MREVFKFWGFGPDAYHAVVGPDRAIGESAGDRAGPVFGRVELCDELIQRCGPLGDRCAGGWWSWLWLDADHPPNGQPLAWLHPPGGATHTIIASTDSNLYSFALDVDATICFIQNEKYLTHRPPGYVRLGINPDRLPSWMRGMALGALATARRLRRQSEPLFPSACDDPAVDVWRFLIRSLVDEHTQTHEVPFWPDGKRYAVTLSSDIDTDYCFRNPGMLDATCAAVERAGMRSAWMIVGLLFERGKAALDGLYAAGHEIGFHDTLHDHRIAFLRPEQIARRLRDASELIDRYAITGFRSPSYLRTPTLFDSLDRVLSYDMSVHDTIARASGLSRVQEGGSTCFPFTIDQTNLLEIPTTVPEDWNLELSGCSADSAVTRQIEAVSRIARRGGVANICTHPEPHITLRPAWLDAYARLLEWIADDGRAWLACPGEVDRHWRRRRADIDARWGAGESGRVDRAHAGVEVGAEGDESHRSISLLRELAQAEACGSRSRGTCETRS